MTELANKPFEQSYSLTVKKGVEVREEREAENPKLIHETRLISINYIVSNRLNLKRYKSFNAKLHFIVTRKIITGLL